MSSVSYPPGRPLAIAEVLDLAVQIFKATVVRCIPYGILAVAFEQLPNIHDLGSGAVRQPFGGGRPIWLVLFAVGTLLALMTWAALLLRQRAIIEHTPTTFKAELTETLRRLPSFVVATVLFFVAVGAPSALLLVAPAPTHPWLRVPVIAVGMYLAILLSSVWPAVMLARRGPLGALRHSVGLVWGNWWRVLAVYGVGAVAVFVLAILVSCVIALVVPALVEDIPVMMAVFTVLANAMIAVVAPFVGALLLAVFGELRARKEGADLEQRIAGLAAAE
jgi:hypothetical protein